MRISIEFSLTFCPNSCSPPSPASSVFELGELLKDQKANPSTQAPFFGSLSLGMGIPLPGCEQVHFILICVSFV